MDFLNSLNEIRKNNHKFGIWEKEQKDKQAQRDVLNETREYTPEELEKARALGENIINAIDIMDNHSESVAENVEAATVPMIGFSPYLGGGLAMIASAKFLINPAYMKIREKRKEVLDSDAAKNLLEEIKNHYKDSSNTSVKYFDEHSLLSSWDLRRIDNVVLKNKVKDFQKDYAKKIAKYNRKINLGMWGTVGAAVASFIGASIYAASLQVEGSKIARYQARKMLEDPKAFVNYTPEQIAQAKAEIEANPALRKQKKKEKLNQGFFKSIKNLFRDRAEYQRAKMFDTDDAKLVQRDLSPQELIQAEKDKEVIQRTVKIVNNQAEKYSENMEVAAGVIIGGTPFLGAAIGGLFKFVFEKTGVLDSWIDKQVANIGSEEIKQVYEEYKALATKKNKSAKEKLEQIGKFSDFSFRFRESIKKVDKNGAKEKVKLSLKDVWKNNFALAMANRTSRGWVIAGIGAVATSIAGLALGLKLQKSAARAGRYTAKRELEEDPRNFIGYTQEDYKEVENVKATKKEQSKVKEVLMFIPNVLKQYYAYDKYRKHEFKEEQLLNEQLMKQDVSAEQLKDAKNLQRKLFNTFEKVDDNSQIYSESMEAAIEIAQPFVLYGGALAALAPIVYYGSLMAKGKKSPTEAIKMTSKFLEKTSRVMKTDLFKKYLNSISKNMPNAVEQNVVFEKPFASVLSGVKLADDSVISVLEKSIQNIKNSIKNIENVPDEIFWKHTDNIKELLNKSGAITSEETLSIINKSIDAFKYLPKQERSDILNMFFNPETIKNMPKDRYKHAVYNIKYVLKKALPDEKKKVLEQTLQEMTGSKSSLDDIFDFLSKQNNVEQFTEAMQKINEVNFAKYIPEQIKNITLKDIAKKSLEKYSSDPKKHIKELRESFVKMTDEEFAKKFQGSFLSDLDKKAAIEILSNFEKIYDNIPKEELKKIFETAFEEFNKNPDEFLKLLKEGNIGSVLQTPELKKALKIAGISWITFNVVITYALESWLAELQLKAGRLGVMKSLEDLEDPRYYANIEPTV